MKRMVLPVTTLHALFLTAAVLYGAGWITPRSQQMHAAKEQPSGAELRYRHNGASHWRTCMVQP